MFSQRLPCPSPRSLTSRDSLPFWGCSLPAELQCPARAPLRPPPELQSQESRYSASRCPLVFAGMDAGEIPICMVASSSILPNWRVNFHSIPRHKVQVPCRHAWTFVLLTGTKPCANNFKYDHGD